MSHTHLPVFERSYIVQAHDIDALQHVNNVRYLQWVQDMAEAHWTHNTTQALRETCFWVVLNHFIEYKREAKLGDTLRMRTFVERQEGVRSCRVVEFYRESDQKMVARARSEWCMMDIQSKRPTRIPDTIKVLFVGAEQ